MTTMNNALNKLQEQCTMTTMNNEQWLMTMTNDNNDNKQWL